MAALAVCLGGDTLPRAPYVIYLGDRDERADSGFVRFKAAMAGHTGSRIELVYRTLPPAGQEADWWQAWRREPPRVVVAPTADTALAARQHLPAAPLVFASYSNPVQLGLVRNLLHPGHGITGVWIDDRLDAKRLELLKDAHPAIRQVAVLTDEDWARAGQGASRLALVCARLHLSCHLHAAADANAVRTLLRPPTLVAADAWYIPPTAVSYWAQADIITALRHASIPAMFSTEQEVERGGQMGLALDTAFVYGTLADLAARRLRGENGDIAVERPFRYRLVLHAQGPYPAIEAAVLRRADRIVTDD